VTVLDWTPRVAVIGEVGQAHDGSLGTAHAFIDAIAVAGADAVKFQPTSPPRRARPTNRGG
jgi:sialic acid synthase SpsE